MCRYPTSDMSQRPPKSAYELLMEANRKKDASMWFTNERCEKCNSIVYTNGKLYWYKGGCENNGKRKFMKENM